MSSWGKWYGLTKLVAERRMGREEIQDPILGMLSLSLHIHKMKKAKIKGKREILKRGKEILQSVIKSSSIL